MINWIKWLRIQKGSKVVTLSPDPINDIQTVMYKRNGLIMTEGWDGKIGYRVTDVRLARRKEIKQGFKEKAK